MNKIENSHSRGRLKTVIGLDPISAGFWLANMGRQPGNAVALVGWGLGIKWVNEEIATFSEIYFFKHSNVLSSWKFTSLFFVVIECLFLVPDCFLISDN